MLGLVGKAVVGRGLQVNQEKLREWPDGIPEIARQRERTGFRLFYRILNLRIRRV